jgi:hypothetical protein
MAVKLGRKFEREVSAVFIALFLFAVAWQQYFCSPGPEATNQKLSQ